jgi:hypothetical protein
MVIFKILEICKLPLANCKGRVNCPALKLQQSVLYSHGGEDGYEQATKQSFVVHLVAENTV